MKKPLILLALSILAMKNLHASIQSGDFIFYDLDCGAMCDAIEEATLEQFGVSGPRLSHIGVVEIGDDGKTWVWEAWPGRGVSRISLRESLERKSARIFSISFEEKWRPTALKALSQLKSKEGRPYDSYFLVNNSSYYCSELIHETWPAMFQLRPMYFGSPTTKSSTVWSQHYQSLMMEVPSGELGISPLGIYLAGIENSLFDMTSIREFSVKQ